MTVTTALLLCFSGDWFSVPRLFNTGEVTGASLEATLGMACSNFLCPCKFIFCLLYNCTRCMHGVLTTILILLRVF